MDTNETLVANTRVEETARYRSPFARLQSESDNGPLMSTSVVLIWNTVRQKGSTLGGLRRMVEGRERTVRHVAPPLPSRARYEYTRWSQVLPTQ